MVKAPSGEADQAVVEAAAGELYGVDPDRFVAARDAAAKELSGAGQRAEAAAVRALRKPSVVGWALNLLVREDRVQVDALLSVGEELRHAQGTLSGDALRQLTGQRLQVVRAVANRAAELAAGAERPLAPPVVEAVTRSLDAALTDPATAQVLVTGRVLGELAYAGLGDASAADGPRLSVVPSGGHTSSGDRPRSASAEHKRAVRAAERAVAEAADELEAAEERATRARDAAAAANLRVATAEETLSAAQAELDAARHDEEIAERASELATKTQDRSARRLEAAQDHLADLIPR